MKIKSIAKVSTNLLAIGIEEMDGQERVFFIAAPSEIRDRFADSLSAMIVLQNLQDV